MKIFYPYFKIILFYKLIKIKNEKAYQKIQIASRDVVFPRRKQRQTREKIFKTFFNKKKNILNEKVSQKINYFLINYFFTIIIFFASKKRPKNIQNNINTGWPEN